MSDLPRRRRRRTALFITVGVVLAVIAVGIVRSRLDDKPQCFEQTYEFTGTTIRPPQQALDDYLANHDEPLPLGGWTVQVTTPDGGATFTSNEGGHWTAEVSGGQVRHYSGCRS